MKGRYMGVVGMANGGIVVLAMLAALAIALNGCGGSNFEGGGEALPSSDYGRTLPTGSGERGSGASAPGQKGEGPMVLYTANDSVLAHNGVTLNVPDGWSGRVLFLDPEGQRFLFQVANFQLPEQQGISPPIELPPGEEDPIVTMSGQDMVLTLIVRDELQAGSAPMISVDDFLSGPRVLRDKGLAVSYGCVNDRCFDIELLVGTATPDSSVVKKANEVLESLRTE